MPMTTPQVHSSWFRNHAKIWVASLVGVGLSVALPHDWALLTRALVSWNVAVLILLTMTYWHLNGLGAQQLRERYRDDDPSATVILLVVVGAAILSIAAIVAFLSTLKSVPAADKAVHVLLAALTIIDSWLLVPTIFIVHYADMYYSPQDGEPPLKFPSTLEPLFWDFAYFSFTIAAACQTADVSTTKTDMRRAVLAQSVISFLFNLAVLGFAINHHGRPAGLITRRRAPPASKSPVVSRSAEIGLIRWTWKPALMATARSWAREKAVRRNRQAGFRRCNRRCAPSG